MKINALAGAIRALLLGGAVACQSACTSQTAIAIAKLESDAAVEVAADAPSAPDDVADGPGDPSADRAGPEAGPEATPDLPRDVATETKADVPPDTSKDSRVVLDSGATVLFYDSFDNGYLANWKLSESSDGPITDNLDGTNKIATLDSSNTDVSRLRTNLDGSLFTDTDISASIRVRIDSAPASTRVVRLTVRQSTSTANYFYAVGVTVTKDGAMTNVGVFKKVPDNNNNYTEVALATSPQFVPSIQMGTWRTMRITVSGTGPTKLSVSFEGEQGASFTDDCTSTLTSTEGVKVQNGGCIAGQTALGIQVEKGIIASVDDVLVTTP